MAKKKLYYEFGEFQLDVRERALLRNGAALQLTPKAFDTLVVLVENAGSLVEKDEMMRVVWPDSFVEEIGLARNISVLRKALGQETGGPQFIETVPKRGYRFTAPVHEHVDADELIFEQSSLSQTVEIYREYSTSEGRAARAAPSVDVAPSQSVTPILDLAPHRALWSSRKAAAVLAVFAVLILAALWYLIANRTRPFDRGKIRSIAVLPFRRLDSADDSDRLGIGMADTLITQLSNLQSINVRPTRDVMRYELSPQDISQTGKALGVDAVLDGSIQRDGDRVRVTVRLIHTDSNSQIWASQLDEKLTDIFVLQDTIATQVAKSLSLTLSDLEQQQIRKTSTRDVEAYQEYLKGRYFWNKRTKEDQEKTIAHFEQAIRISPNYALAYTGLADVHAIRANIARTPESRERLYKLAQIAAARAIEIDANLAEAHTSLGFILRSSDWNWSESEKELKRAIELSPNYPTAHHYYGLLLATTGRTDEALSEIEMAQKLDPLSLIINADLAMLYIFAHQPGRAIDVAKAALEIDAQFPRLRRMLMWAYEESGMVDEAVRESQGIRETEGWDPIFTMSILGYGYALKGQREKAQEIVEKLLALSDQISPATVQAAAVCAALGDKDRAFELLEKGRSFRNDRLLWIKVDPRFDSLRNDQRFKELLRNMNLPQ